MINVKVGPSRKNVSTDWAKGVANGVQTAELRVRLGTPHRLASEFLALEGGIKRRAERAGMAATAGFQSKIFGFARLVAPPGGVRQIVNRIPQSWIAGEPSGDGAAFARSPGDWRHAHRMRKMG